MTDMIPFAADTIVGVVRCTKEAWQGSQNVEHLLCVIEDEYTEIVEHLLCVIEDEYTEII